MDDCVLLKLAIDNSRRVSYSFARPQIGYIAEH